PSAVKLRKRWRIAPRGEIVTKPSLRSRLMLRVRVVASITRTTEMVPIETGWAFRMAVRMANWVERRPALRRALSNRLVIARETRRKLKEAQYPVPVRSRGKEAGSIMALDLYTQVKI